MSALIVRRRFHAPAWLAPAVLAALVVLAASALALRVLPATSTISLPSLAPVPASRAALVASDLPSQMSRCSDGDINSYLARLSGEGSPAYAPLAAEWSRLRSAGATSGWASSWTSKQVECDLPAGDRTGSSAMSLSFRFASADQAAAAFGSGFLDLRPDAGAAGLARGTATGLGPDSWLLEQQTPGPPLVAAYWASGSLLVFLTTQGLPLETGRRAALNIESRIG